MLCLLWTCGAKGQDIKVRDGEEVKRKEEEWKEQGDRGTITWKYDSQKEMNQGRRWEKRMDRRWYVEVVE